MKNYKVQFEIKFRGNTIKKFSTTVPADDQNEAFDKAKNYIDSKTESNVLDIKELEETPIIENGFSDELNFLMNLETMGNILEEKGISNLSKQDVKRLTGILDRVKEILNDL